MRQQAISRVINGTGPGFIRQIEESLAREGYLTGALIRSPRNYLAEGGLLEVFSLNTLSVKEKLPARFFKSASETPGARQAIGIYEALYDWVVPTTILAFAPHIERLARLSEGDTFLDTTKKILKFYHSYLERPSADWKRNIATISILLNVAHNNGSMAEDLGSKYTTTKEHGVDEEYLDKLSNLHRYLPQGTDHKTLRGIYNECFQTITRLG